MAQNLLTDKQIRNAKARGRDTLLADGDGLYLRLRPGRAKQWVFIYRLDGERKKRGLGTYPAVGLSMAHELAAHCREQVAKGVDPVEAEQRASVERRAERQREAGRVTVRGMFDSYQRRRLKTRKDRGEAALRQFEKNVFPFIGERFATEINQADIWSIINRVIDRDANRQAGLLLTELRQMFRYAEGTGVIPTDPTRSINKADFGGNSRIRDRVLSADEIRELSEKLPESGLSARLQAAAWIMLATCARVGELSSARWSDVDLEAGTWTIPAEVAKNGREHLIHLSGFAHRHFASVPHEAGCEWVYPGREKKKKHIGVESKKKRKHISVESMQKMFRDRQRSKPLKGRSLQAGALALTGGDWTAHDLRRSGATLMGELRIRPDVIDRALNHVAASRVTRTYQHQELMEDRREALRLLGERLDAILAADPGKVAMFPKRRA